MFRRIFQFGVKWIHGLGELVLLQALLEWLFIVSKKLYIVIVAPMLCLGFLKMGEE